MSDDVRARAEALCDYLDKTSGGEEWKGASLVRQLRAALAVAPATAQPGAWQRGHRPDTLRPISVEVCETSDLVDDDVVFHDGEWWVILDHPENDGRQVYAAPIIDDSGGQDEPDFIEAAWFVRVVPLYAAPPDPGDAAAVRDACARLCESFKEHLWSGAAAPGTHAGSVATLLAGAIRRIPLPAPATAVVEAMPTRGDVGRPEATRDPVFLLQWRERNRPVRYNRWQVDSVWFTRQEAEDFAKAHAHRWGSDKGGPCWQVYCVPANGDLAALLKVVTKRAAEAAATHAAKGGNCG